MDARIQFRVDEETKRLAQKMAESQGSTLSDACRRLTEELAEQQRQLLAHDEWLTLQVNQAFEKLNNDSSYFYDHSSAQKDITVRKERIRAAFKRDKQ